jgi:hypothetical protein
MHLVTRTGEPSFRFSHAFLAILCLFSALTLGEVEARAAVQVTATVDRNVMSPDDTLIFTVTSESGVDEDVSPPTLPSFQDFQVLNQWASDETQGNLVSTPNGPQFRSLRTVKSSYQLQPKREGTLSIGSAEVVINGRTFHTKPITVRVGRGLGGGGGSAGQNRGSGPPSGIQPPPGFGDEEDEDDAFSQLLRRGFPHAGGGSRTMPVNPNEAFFVQVETDKTEAYVNEQVTVSFYLYTRGQIRDLDTLKYPALKGFWKEDIEIATHLNFTQEVVNGIPYKKALLASFALFPIKEGVSTIDSYTAKCSVLPSDDPFGMFGGGKAYTYTKSSQPVKVTVKPLPTAGRPADFTGAVGDFQVSARVEDHNIIANQPFAFKIRFEGTGNAKLIEIPPFQPPQGMEIYDTQNEAKFFRTGTSFKDFSLLLIPRQEGEYTLPPVSVSIFDPQKKQYVTKTTEPVRVRVNAGQGMPTNNGKDKSLSVDTGPEAKKLKQGPVEPRLVMEWQRSKPMSLAEQAFGYLGLFSLVGITLLWRARSEFGWGQKKKDITRRLRARMTRIHGLVAKGDWRAVGIETTNAVYFVLGEVSGEGGANVEFEKLLRKAPPSVRRELAEPLIKQMEVFQVLGFAPEAAVGALKEPAALKTSVAQMEALMEKAVALGLSSGAAGEGEAG